ncbi:MAG: CoA protein activase [Clostridia bacterium]|nr:CoA protein activase [Clostridia bacterium]
MRVTFPHMGNMWISVKALLENLDLDVVVPPPCTNRTMSLGVRHSPEFICLPLKVNLGNYMEAAEMGANTIAIAGGVGPCRFGYYSRLQKEILDDLGYNYRMVILEPPQRHFGEIFKEMDKLTKFSLGQFFTAARLAWLKCCLIDAVEERVHKLRAWELTAGQVDKVYKEALSNIDASQTRREIIKAKERALESLNDIRTDSTREVVRVAIVGEIYTILEPYVNQDAERHLGRLGVEIDKSLYLSRWVNDHLLGGFLPLESSRDALKMAAPYLNSFVGGHGRESVGYTVKYARESYDGVIQIAPLTCGPEIVAEAILPEVAVKEGIPVMTIYVDEHSGEAGLITRLEAFVDMIRRRKYHGWDAAAGQERGFEDVLSRG